MLTDGAESVAYRHAAAEGPMKRTRSQTSEMHSDVTPNAKRHKKAPASLEADSSITNLKLLATRWKKAELEFYDPLESSEDKPNYAPSIAGNKKNSRPTVRHLVNAANEFARRFPFRSTEEDEEMNDEMPSDSPFLLVATGVCDKWHVPAKFRNDHAVRFMLVPGETKNDSILFIRCMAGPEHGAFDGFIGVNIDDWIKDNGLRKVLYRVDAGGTAYQPDKAWRPRLPDRSNPNLDASALLKGAPFARLVIEVDLSHRGADALREVGFVALNNPYTRLFLAVKIWKKGQAGNFAAAAVLWGKNEDGVISVHQAIDFGTKAMKDQSKVKFQEVGHANTLPPVVGWTRPQPSHEHATIRSMLDSLPDTPNVEMNEGWGITLPAADLLFRTSTDLSTDETPYYLDMHDAIQDCVINLQDFAWIVNSHNF